VREVHPWEKRRGGAFMRAIRRETPAFRRCSGERRASEVAGLRLYLRGRPRAGAAELRKTRADPTWEYYGPLNYEPVFDELRKDPRFDEILKQSQKPFPRL